MDLTAKTTLYIVIGFSVIGFIFILIKELLKPSEKEAFGLSNLWLRYISWLVIAPLFLIPAYFGKPYFNILIMIIAAFCLKEYFKLTKLWEFDIYKWEGRIFSFLLLLVTLSNFVTKYLFYILPIFVILTVLITPVFLRKTEEAT
ncbi:MAG: hypothetical protein FJZ16_02595, partial [Candidatus Omnitrophica bacterium]|nr:hypothetical protein [Candidatus Omnitrophota bacterium]